MFFRCVVFGGVRTFAFHPFEVAPIVLSSFRFHVVCPDPFYFLQLCFFTLPRRPEGDNKSGNWNVQQVTLHRMPWGPGPKPKTTTTITPARDPKQSFLFSGGVGRKGQGCAFSGGGLLLAGLGVGPGCGTGRPASWAKLIGKTQLVQ